MASNKTASVKKNTAEDKKKVASPAKVEKNATAKSEKKEKAAPALVDKKNATSVANNTKKATPSVNVTKAAPAATANFTAKAEVKKEGVIEGKLKPKN